MGISEIWKLKIWKHHNQNRADKTTELDTQQITYAIASRTTKA